MPRFYKRKEGAKPRVRIDEESMRKAVQEALKGESGIQTIAKKYGVDRMSLKRYKAKYAINPNSPMKSDYKKKINIFEGKGRGVCGLPKNVCKN